MEQERRIEDLEVRLAFQEDTIQSLNDTLIAQGEALAELRLALQRVNEQVRRLQPGEGGGAAEHEPPPHY
ncbi:SlyX family protein [Alkalilimnicola sp. S0819]|nr:SlyX family protein [Alkalilimnicola sp. S0819]MPQ15093.1 lysis protein [Alkalilimnicola sp. S0819]